MAKALINTEKKHRTLNEFIVVVIIIAVLMTFLLDLFFAQQDRITNTAFVGVAQSFTSKVNIIHAQWLMDDQPTKVSLNRMNSEDKEYVEVNDAGWIDNQHASLACQEIWQQTLLMPLQVVKSLVTVVEIKNKAIKNGRLCRYSIANGQSFDYRSDTGKVKQVY
jgi:competence protein ComGC